MSRQRLRTPWPAGAQRPPRRETAQQSAKADQFLRQGGFRGKKRGRGGSRGEYSDRGRGGHRGGGRGGSGGYKGSGRGPTIVQSGIHYHTW